MARFGRLAQEANMATKVLLTGSETFTGGNGNYIVTDNLSGTDTASSVGSNTLTLGNGIDQVTLGSGGNNTIRLGGASNTSSDTLMIGGASNTITVNGSGKNQVTTVGGINTITVGPGRNTITLGEAASGSPDTVTTAAGGNVVLVSAAAITGDTLNGAMTSGDGTTNRLVLTATGTMSPAKVSGFAFWKLASGGPNVLNLSDTNFVRLPGGRINISGGNSGNTVNAATLSATHSVRIAAGSGTDTLIGGAGNDILVARSNTTMTGGGGANQFTFAHIGTNGITDFGASASNEIVVRNSGFNLGADQGHGTASPQHLAWSAYAGNSTGTFRTTSQRFAYNTTNGTLSYSADGSGSAGSAVVVLAGHPNLVPGLIGNLFFTA
jgi:Ca2+-binding RTX toxin-like protein